MLTTSTPIDVSSEAIEIQSDTDFIAFWLMVDCPARTLLGLSLIHI